MEPSSRHSGMPMKCMSRNAVRSAGAGIYNRALSAGRYEHPTVATKI